MLDDVFMTVDLAARRDLYFASGSDRCHAWLYLPEAADAGPPPVIVMAHGLGAIKVLRLSAFAERFQAAGYACFVFDYRYFGDSEGQPRELLSIARQREDWQAALRFVRSLPEVDSSRVVLWGTSFGGGHVIATAAVDHEVVAAVAQCPFTDGVASVLQIAPRESARLILAGAKDRLAQLAARKPVRVKVAARPGELGLMNDGEAVDTVIALLEASGLTEAEYRNEVPARIALEIAFDAPGRKAGQIQCPILFCVCDADTVAPAEATLRHAAKAPRGEIRRYPVGHFDIYIGEPFERVVADQLAFLHTHVPTAATN